MKKMKEFLLASSIAIANILPIELPQTNLFYKGDPEIVRLRDACDNEVNVEISKDVKSGITMLKRGNLPTIYIYLSKDQKEFRKVVSKNRKTPRVRSVSLANNEIIALTKHLMNRSKMLKKYKDIKLQELIEFLSCVDKAAKIHTKQIPMEFANQEEVDKLMGKVARTKSKLFEDTLSPTDSLTELPQTNINLKQDYYYTD
nr:hypothetical protein [Gracilaria tikvahiae]